MERKEAIQIIKNNWPSVRHMLSEALEFLLPELKERESDGEKIRKHLVTLFKGEYGKSSNARFAGIKVKDILAWLEKQGEHKKDATRDKIAEYLKNLILDQSQRGAHMLDYEGRIEEEVDFIISIAKNELKKVEQKHADNIEPKFHANDFITDGERIFQIKETVWERNNRNDGSTYCESLIVNLKDGVTYTNNTDLKEYHLWTIEDAKDGDVLVYPDNTLTIFRYRLSGLDAGLYMSHVLLTDKIEFKQTCAINIVLPATKEQRDALMKAMDDAGYIFDFEKKELRKIEKKSEWNEEDERKIAILEALCDDQINSSTPGSTMYREMQELKEWLKGRVQSKQEWSKEDCLQLQAATDICKSSGHTITSNWLENLKDRVQPQSKREWSEENKCMLNNIIDTLKPLSQTTHSGYAINSMIDWLKSIKPQKQWKPTEEQRNAICYAAGYVSHEHPEITKVLKGLLNDIELME